MKKCSKCDEVKSFGEFFKNKNNNDGFGYHCKVCRKAYDEANKENIAKREKTYKEVNKENIVKQMKAWREANKENIKAYSKTYSKAYREANKERLAERRKAYYKANKERLKDYQKYHQKENRDKIANRAKAYREANKEEIAKRDKAYGEANRGRLKDYKKAYYEANKDKIKAYREENKDEINKRKKIHYYAKRDEYIEQLKQIIEPNNDGKWIYIMACGVYYKIGISNNPLKRVQQIETRTQAPTEIIYLARANYGRTIDIEQIIHHELSSMNIPMPYAKGSHKDHVSKEWFFGSIDKMVEVVSQYASIKELVN